MVYTSESPESTEKIAEEIGRSLKGGEVLVLSGELGAGKTTFTKGIARGLDIKDTITSPTFTIMNSYSGRLPLFHYDMYRIENADEIYELGIYDNLFTGGVSVIEWNRFDLSGLKTIYVSIEYLDGDRRKIVIS